MMTATAFAGTMATAQLGVDHSYNVVTGTPFVEIQANETGQSAYLLNVTAWGVQSDGENVQIQSTDNPRTSSFAAMFRWNETDRRKMECWGGQDNTTLEWVLVSNADIHNVPTTCLVGGWDAHLSGGISILAVDTPFHFRLNPQNGTEVFDQYDYTTIGLFVRLNSETLTDDPQSIMLFDVRPEDWDRWLADAGLGAGASTQSAGAGAQAASPMAVLAAAGVAGAAGVASGACWARRGRRQ